MSKEIEQFNEAFVKFIGAVVMYPVVVFSYVFVMSKMWEWFVTAQFSVAVPPWWVLYGIALMSRLILFKSDQYKETDEMEARKLPVAIRYLQCSCVFWLFLGMAYLAKTYGPMIGG